MGIRQLLDLSGEKWIQGPRVQYPKAKRWTFIVVINDVPKVRVMDMIIFLNDQPCCHGVEFFKFENAYLVPQFYEEEDAVAAMVAFRDKFGDHTLE